MKRNVIISAVILAVVVIVAASCSPGRDFRRYPDYSRRSERVIVIQPHGYPVTGRRGGYGSRDRDYRYDEGRNDNRRYQSRNNQYNKNNNGRHRGRGNEND